MTYVGSSFRFIPLARSMQFRGSPSTDHKELAPIETTAAASVPASPDEFIASGSSSADSDISSIHTNPEEREHFQAVTHTLGDLKGKIPDEQLDILTNAFNFAQTEIGWYKKTGKRWQKKADNLGGEFELTANKLESTSSALEVTATTLAVTLDTLKRKQIEVANLRQSKLELEHKYALQEQKLKHTEQELKEHLKDMETIDSEIDRLIQEAKVIQQKLESISEASEEPEPKRKRTI